MYVLQAIHEPPFIDHLYIGNIKGKQPCKKQMPRSSIMACQKAVLLEKLQQVFGYSQFRSDQVAIMQQVLAGQDVVVIMPTGAGKSLCYQLPALIKPGTALVISPLIALMKNQIDQLRRLGISAYFLNSTLSQREANYVKKETQAGHVQLLYIAPESLNKEENLGFLKSFEISFVAVDEAHCISEWGHDFRPEYRRIKEVLGQVSTAPTIALTATATPKVQLDIQKNLHVEQAQVFKSSFNRANLFYEVVAKQDARKHLISFLRQRANQSGIVYCLTRKKVEDITAFLRINDIEAVAYHAGLDGKIRMQNQDAFLSKQVPVIVATIAFGMGIDKADVRFVVHYDAPKSLEGYYQETGRAGRDSKPAHCLMLFSYHDINKVEKFNKDKPLSERENIHMLLEEVIAYAESPICRRKQLLLYFGEHYDKACCHQCDNCLAPNERFVASKHLKRILEIAQQQDAPNSLPYVIDLLSGKKTTDRPKEKDEQVSPHFQDAREGKAFWHSLLRQAIEQDFLQRNTEFTNCMESLVVTKKGQAFLRASGEVHFQQPHIYKKARTEEIEEGLQREVLIKKNGAADPELLGKLIKLQKKLSKAAQIPAYVVFQESSLEEMATRYPTTEEAMLQIQGISKGKMDKYGKSFLALIQAYVTSHGIETHKSVLMKSAGLQSQLKINIIKQVDKKIHLEDIAEYLGISYEQLLEEMTHICYSGTKLNVNYHLDSLLDAHQQHEIYTYFLHGQTDDLRVAYKALSDYTKEEIQLMHIKFVSELAN